MHIAASSVDAQASIARAGGIEHICTAMAVHAQSEARPPQRQKKTRNFKPYPDFFLDFSLIYQIWVNGLDLNRFFGFCLF